MLRLTNLKKSSKSKFGAEFVVTITDFGEAARQKSFLRIHLLINSHNFKVVYMIFIFYELTYVLVLPSYYF